MDYSKQQEKQLIKDENLFYRLVYLNVKKVKLVFSGKLKTDYFGPVLMVLSTTGREFLSIISQDMSYLRTAYPDDERIHKVIEDSSFRIDTYLEKNGVIKIPTDEPRAVLDAIRKRNAEEGMRGHIQQVQKETESFFDEFEICKKLDKIIDNWINSSDFDEKRFRKFVADNNLDLLGPLTIGGRRPIRDLLPQHMLKAKRRWKLFLEEKQNNGSLLLDLEYVNELVHPANMEKFQRGSRIMNSKEHDKEINALQRAAEQIKKGH